MKVKKLNGKSNVLGKNVKKYRELRHLTQRELSDKIALLGVDIYHSDISQIENQKLLLKDFEIIVIDKGSTDNTIKISKDAKVLEKRFGGLKKITYLCSPKRDEKNHGSFEIGSLNYW